MLETKKCHLKMYFTILRHILKTGTGTIEHIYLYFSFIIFSKEMQISDQHLYWAYQAKKTIMLIKCLHLFVLTYMKFLKACHINVIYDKCMFIYCNSVGLY